MAAEMSLRNLLIPSRTYQLGAEACINFSCLLPRDGPLSCQPKLAAICQQEFQHFSNESYVCHLHPASMSALTDLGSPDGRVPADAFVLHVLLSLIQQVLSAQGRKGTCKQAAFH